MGLLKKIISFFKDKNEDKANSCPQNKEYRLFVPDTRTPQEKDLLMRTFLHHDAYSVANGVCGIGQADNERFILENISIMKAVEYVSTLDNTCCPECWPLDGQQYPIDVESRPPVPRHENCRCLYLGVPKTFRELGLDMDEFEEVARPWAIVEYRYTFKKDPTRKLKTPKRTILRYGQFKGTAEEWIRTLPPKEQRPFFPSDFAYELWSKNIIKAIDLIDENTWKVRTDTELENLIK